MKRNRIRIKNDIAYRGWCLGRLFLRVYHLCSFLIVSVFVTGVFKGFFNLLTGHLYGFPICSLFISGYTDFAFKVWLAKYDIGIVVHRRSVSGSGRKYLVAIHRKTGIACLGL